jgi:hypothetical protein
MIIYTHQKSKKRKMNAKERALKESWEELLKKTAIKTTKTKQKTAAYTESKPYRRETPHYPSLNSNEYNCFKKNVQQYTGDKMKGIGTLHKSNAVPIFTDEEARDQASMRR